MPAPGGDEQGSRRTHVSSCKSPFDTLTSFWRGFFKMLLSNILPTRIYTEAWEQPASKPFFPYILTTFGFSTITDNEVDHRQTAFRYSFEYLSILNGQIAIRRIKLEVALLARVEASIVSEMLTSPLGKILQN